MRSRFVFLPAFVLYFVIFAFTALATETTPLKGGTFPDIVLSAPEKTSEKEYLGLSAKNSFKVSQIKTDLLIIEFFSMYCPYCQKEAPNVNELYRIISERAGLKNKVKIIGIGAGNTPFEVDVFRQQYNIQFPVFSDESFSAHKVVGEVRTPHFFVIRRSSDGSNAVVYSKVGSIQDPKEFLDMIIKETGLR
jgi:peroxiredoxin